MASGDGYLVFDSAAALTNSRASTYALQADTYTQVGKGRPKYVEVWSDGSFTSGEEVIYIQLKAGTTSPGGTEIMRFGPIAASTLATAGMVAKFVLPPINMNDYFSLYYSAETALTAGGAVTSLITLNP